MANPLLARLSNSGRETLVQWKIANLLRKLARVRLSGGLNQKNQKVDVEELSSMTCIEIIIEAPPSSKQKFRKG